jgi:hypothetical protein
MAFVKLQPAALSPTPADFARHFLAAAAMLREAKGRAPAVLPGPRGVGMYPDETCFDTARPSWLPYWFDDFTETACSWNEGLFGNKTGDTTQPGTFTTDANGNVVATAAPATIQNAMAACAQQGGSWNATLQACQPSFVSQYGLLIGAGVLGLVVLSFAFGGRR